MGIMNSDEWCHYSDMPSPKAYQKTTQKDMNKSQIMKRIIELETPITTRIINDREFRATDTDEYQKSRIELKVLREMIKDELYLPNYVHGLHPQRPDIESLENWKSKNINLK